MAKPPLVRFVARPRRKIHLVPAASALTPLELAFLSLLFWIFFVPVAAQLGALRDGHAPRPRLGYPAAHGHIHGHIHGLPGGGVHRRHHLQQSPAGGALRLPIWVEERARKVGEGRLERVQAARRRAHGGVEEDDNSRTTSIVEAAGENRTASVLSVDGSAPTGEPAVEPRLSATPRGQPASAPAPLAQPDSSTPRSLGNKPTESLSFFSSAALPVRGPDYFSTSPDQPSQSTSPLASGLARAASTSPSSLVSAAASDASATSSGKFDTSTSVSLKSLPSAGNQANGDPAGFATVGPAAAEPASPSKVTGPPVKDAGPSPVSEAVPQAVKGSKGPGDGARGGGATRQAESPSASTTSEVGGAFGPGLTVMLLSGGGGAASTGGGNAAEPKARARTRTTPRNFFSSTTPPAPAAAVTSTSAPAALAPASDASATGRRTKAAAGKAGGESPPASAVASTSSLNADTTNPAGVGASFAPPSEVAATAVSSAVASLQASASASEAAESVGVGIAMTVDSTRPPAVASSAAAPVPAAVTSDAGAETSTGAGAGQTTPPTASTPQTTSATTATATASMSMAADSSPSS